MNSVGNAQLVRVIYICVCVRKNGKKEGLQVLMHKEYSGVECTLFLLVCSKRNNALFDIDA